MPKVRKTEARIAEDQWQRYTRARDHGHLDYVRTADKCNNFYIGEQWDPSLKRELESSGRPALTINMVLSTVNTVLGEQASKRSEFKFKPRSGGTEETATVLTKLTSTIKDANNYDWLESQVFADGIIQHGRGWLDLRMAFDEHMQGDIRIKSNDPKNVVLDPDASEYDPSTWREIFETRWATVEEVESVYGRKKADEVRLIGVNADRYGTDSVLWEDDHFGDTSDSELNGMGMAYTEGEEKRIKKIRLIERQYVKLVPVRKFVSLLAGDMSIVPETWSDTKARKFAQKHNLAVLQQVDKKIRWTTTADKVVLADSWSPYATFTKVPYFAYFRRGKPFGLVSNLLSPQEQLNKLSSQELHILNTTANSGWIVETGSLVGMSMDDLRNQGAKTGLVLEVNKGFTPPEKIKSNTVPTGIERAAMNSATFIKEISGVNDALLGFDSAEVSGVALQQKQFRGQVQMQVPFDNLQRTRLLVANKIIELIQQFYTEERVFNVSTSGINTEEPENEQLVINHQIGAYDVVNDVTVGKYDVVLSSAPARDSYDDAQFAEAVNLRQIGVAIPDDRIVEHSHLDNKAELAEELRQIAGRGKKSPEELEIERLLTEMQIRGVVADTEKAEREVLHVEAEIEKIMAEAEFKDGGMGSPEARLRLEELENRLTIARENNDLRRMLAMLSDLNASDRDITALRGRLIEGTVMEREKRKTALLTNAQTERMRKQTQKSKEGAS